MNKKLLVVLIVLMTLSLLGIIFVQAYWIKKSIEDKEEQFYQTVSQVLDNVASKIETREINEYGDKFIALKDSVGKPSEYQIRDIFFREVDEDSREVTIYNHGILKENYNVPPSFFDNDLLSDSTTTITSYTSKTVETVLKENFGMDGKGYSFTPIKKITKFGDISRFEKLQFEESFRDAANRRPMYKRVSKEEIKAALKEEFKNRKIDIDFEYGIYSKGLPTSVKSRKFKFDPETINRTPIFRDSEGKTDFSLLVSFPDKKEYLIGSILGMALITFLFTTIILITYVGAIYQLIRQKKISEIKTDFINNMTHEFKTPIATINLAVEAIKNPATIGDKEKVSRYLQMIRDENKRMHAQVENVLRISKLEKNQLDISKERVDVHDIIEDAITHVELIVDDRGGYINTHLNAKRTDVLANEMHFTNVLVNVMDNAIKYSPEAPKIDVYTESTKNSIVIKIKDQGSGMSKAVLKKVFEKFYREHTGDIHNVKGHGLGLAYVKKIIDDHQGEVYAESEKGKGSTFYIKLPII